MTYQITNCYNEDFGIYKAKNQTHALAQMYENLGYKVIMTMSHLGIIFVDIGKPNALTVHVDKFQFTKLN